MKNKKKTVVKLLKLMRTNAHKCSKIYKEEGNEKLSYSYEDRAFAYGQVIALLSDNDYFNRIAEIFNLSDEGEVKNGVCNS